MKGMYFKINFRNATFAFFLAVLQYIVLKLRFIISNGNHQLFTILKTNLHIPDRGKYTKPNEDEIFWNIWQSNVDNLHYLPLIMPEFL